MSSPGGKKVLFFQSPNSSSGESDPLPPLALVSTDTTQKAEQYRSESKPDQSASLCSSAVVLPRRDVPPPLAACLCPRAFFSPLPEIRVHSCEAWPRCVGSAFGAERLPGAGRRYFRTCSPNCEA